MVVLLCCLHNHEGERMALDPHVHVTAGNRFTAHPMLNVLTGTPHAHTLHGFYLHNMSLDDMLTAPVTLVFDTPSGFAMQRLEGLDIPAQSSIVVTWNTCPEYLDDLWSLQAAILLVNVDINQELPAALKRLALGQRYRSPGLRSSLLTPTERQVLRLMAHGCSNQQIGERLHLQEKSIRNALTKVYDKLGLENRVKVTKYYWGIP